MRRFHNAAIYAADAIEPAVTNGKLDFPPTSFAEIVAAWSTHVDTVVENDGPRYVISDEFAREIVKLTKEHAEFYDLAINICAMNLFGNYYLPRGLGIFAASVLKGVRRRPTPPHRERKKNWLERAFLYNLVLEVADKFDLSITNNDEVTEAYSASQAITQALNICGRPTKYSEIKNLMVHPNHERFRREARAASSIFHRQRQGDLPTNALASDFQEKVEASTQAVVLDIKRALFPSGAKGKK